MEIFIIPLVVAVVILAVVLFFRAVQRAKVKQALFEERFSKNYDKHLHRRSKLR